MGIGALPGPGDSPRTDEVRLRHLAVQIVAQLPERRDEAIAVLALAEEFARKFVYPEKRRPGPKNVRLRVVEQR